MKLSQQAQAEMIELVNDTAKFYGSAPGEHYNATPTIAQQIYDKIYEQGGPFLQLLPLIPVSEVAGDKVGMSVPGLIASRTDTSADGERAAISVATTESKQFLLKQVNSDVGIKYNLIDSWAKFPNFRNRYNNHVKNAIASDLLRVGWHGTSAAATTNKTNNPNGEDVNIGWLEQIRDYNSGSQYLIGTTQVPVEVGGNDFPSLDALVFDAITRLATWYQSEPTLVALVSRDLVNYSKGRYYGQTDINPEMKQLVDAGIALPSRFGGLPAMTPPFFPANTILVTPLANLPIYYQDSSWRRTQLDNPKKDQYEDFNSRNEGYIVEDFNAASLIENVTIAA